MVRPAQGGQELEEKERTWEIPLVLAAASNSWFKGPGRKQSEAASSCPKD